MANLAASTFPEFEQMTYRADWAPLYVEPVLGSGERITCAIAVSGPSGDVDVVRVIRHEAIRALYGRAARGFVDIIDATCDALREALKQGERSPQLPYSGFHIGPYQWAVAEGLQGIVETGKLAAASLHAMSGREAADDASEDVIATERWERKVRGRTIEHASDLARYFDRKITLQHSRIPTRFGFHTGRYAAQFGVVHKTRPAASLYHLKVRLWELAQITPDLAGEVEERELMLQRPDLTTPSMTLAERNNVRDLLEEVTAEADKKEIYVLHTDKVDEVSRRLYRKARQFG